MKANRVRTYGFTMLEIMLVVAIVGLLAALALPGFIKARENAQNNRFIADLRVATHAFEEYALLRGGYPADTAPAVMPAGMAEYLSKFQWTEPSTIGGQWCWGTTELGVSLMTSAVPDARMVEIDRAIDDGDLITGLFRKRSDGNGFVYLCGT